MNLEATDIFGGRSIGRTPEEGSKAPDEADVVTLRLFSEATHGHVFEHALMQGADRGLN